jgi:bifunctional UDP-N-acetylglucosamine pyrophosphorylase/glucosamine-1-phosphate N-acetyltransferase
MKQDVTIVILAAGLGTRMRSQKAKVLHEAGGMTLIEHVVKSALQLTTPDRIVVVVGHQAAQVRAIVEDKQIRFAVQEEQKGTGHALMMCRSAVPDDKGLLVVLYGDCPLLSETTLHKLVDHHTHSGKAATVVTTMLEDPTGYGRVVTDSAGNVAAIVEQKVATREQHGIRQINSGIYCFDAELLWKHLDEIQPNSVSKEYYLTDIVEIFNAAGLEFGALLHSDANELLGINTRVELAEVDRIFRQRKTQELMLSGVTIEKPDTVTIDAKVEVGQDTIIETCAQLRGKTTVGANCRIGAGAIIRDSQLADAVDISAYTVIAQSRIDSGATLGPFTRLRPNNQVGENAHIGNFVELKNTRVGIGAKAGHLSYLGDSDIGPAANIGAGTITCNYDGTRKHRTQIGERAFIGSDATLVAPLQIGDGAYIAAGSTITENVPDDALGLGRSRQVVKEEWAKKRRAAVKKS